MDKLKKIMDIVGDLQHDVNYYNIENNADNKDKSDRIERVYQSLESAYIELENYISENE